MSTLVTDRLDTESGLVLTQEIEIKREITLAGIRCFLYFHGLPAGTFYFRLYKDGNLIKEYSFTAASAKASANGVNPTHNHFWVYLSLAGDVKLGRGDHELKLESSGYTFDEDSWIGWSKDWDKLDSLTSGVPSDFSEYPYSYKLIEYAPREF
jgi:hypothetical protein